MVQVLLPPGVTSRTWSDGCENRATIEVTQFIPYSRIIAIDEVGDAYNQGPHLLVARHPSDDGLFEPNWAIVTVQNNGSPELELDIAKQIDFFPGSRNAANVGEY